MTFKSSGASEARLPPAQAGPRPTAPAWGRSRGSLVSPNLGGRRTTARNAKTRGVTFRTGSSETAAIPAGPGAGIETGSRNLAGEPLRRTNPCPDLPRARNEVPASRAGGPRAGSGGSVTGRGAPD